MKTKYPRTPHLPWSLGKTNDDITNDDLSHFEGKFVVVTEKMDGENTTMYSDYIHARSIDSKFHYSRAWVKSLQGNIGYKIPKNWRICGENLYAKHSIEYNDLVSYFLAFSVWNEDNICLNWADTILFLEELGIQTPKVLYSGIWDEDKIKNIDLDLNTQEGYVVRNADAFDYNDFSKNVAKFVIENHVQTDTHWMNADIIPNKLKQQKKQKRNRKETVSDDVIYSLK